LPNEVVYAEDLPASRCRPLCVRSCATSIAFREAERCGALGSKQRRTPLYGKRGTYTCHCISFDGTLTFGLAVAWGWGAISIFG